MANELPQIQIDTRKRPTTPTKSGPSLLATIGCLTLAIPAVLFFGAMIAGIASVPLGLQNPFWIGTAADLERQYQLLVDEDAPQIDCAIRPGAVAEAYLQAEDRKRYRKWKALADRHMRAAGLPTMR